MTNWFDSSPTPPENTDKENNLGFGEENKSNSGENASNEQANGSNTEFTAGQDAPPPWASQMPYTSEYASRPAPTPSWTAPDAGANTQPSNPNTQPTNTPPQGSTYHYGVNSQNPVPSGTNYYQPPANKPDPNAPGGYRPQGTYDPYNWQNRTNNPPPVQNGYTPPNSYPPPRPPKKKNSGTVLIAVLGVVCAVVIITLAVLLAVSVSNGNLLGESSSPSSSTTTPSNNASKPTLDITDDVDTGALTTRSIVEMNLDSTVVITTYVNQGSGGFYGGTSGPVEAGSATGIVMTADGYIITNWHVVVNESTGKAFDRVDVQLYDGTVYKSAKVIGADESTDLAVIKIEATKLKPAKFGDSSVLQLGDKVVAIGNAGGLSWTTTQGIVSGLARDVYEDTGYAIKCLQTDAAINPGNSGGPLINDQGQVIAINSAKIVASGYEGLGFSIPINEAKTIIDSLIQHGYVKGRVMLGITGRTLEGYGFRIESIGENSSLANTQAKAGDIITHVNGVRVTDYATMRSELSKYTVGNSIEMTILRVDSRTGQSNSFNITCKLKEYTGS